MEAVTRASLADDEARHIRVVESATGASSYRNVEKAGGTTDSALFDEDTTEGVLTTLVVSSVESDPPALCAPGLLHLPLSYFSFLCIEDNCISFC